jgi:hypothetical protein
MSKMTWIFLGLASIPRFKTMYPRNFPKETPNMHFAGFNFIPYWFNVLNASVGHVRGLAAILSSSAYHRHRPPSFD